MRLHAPVVSARVDAVGYSDEDRLVDVREDAIEAVLWRCQAAEPGPSDEREARYTSLLIEVI